MASLAELDLLPIVVDVPGNATAGTPDEFVVFAAPFAGRVVRVQWVPEAAITANGTNFFTLRIRNRGPAPGTGNVEVATRSYAATNSVAFVSENATLHATATNLKFAFGDVITVEKVVTASGLAMPPGVVIVSVGPN